MAQVKGNQSALLEAVQQLATAKPLISQACQANHQRNRIERRDIKVFDAQGLQNNSSVDSDWGHLLKAIIQVQRNTDCFDTRTGNWKRRTETAYYVASKTHSAEVFAQAIRGHWGVENRNHYVRDVTLGEDASRIRRNPGVFARLRSFTLNILRKNNITNVSEALYDNSLCLDNLCAYAGLL